MKRLIETVLLSAHNICFGWETRKLFFCYALLTKSLLLSANIPGTDGFPKKSTFQNIPF